MKLKLTTLLAAILFSANLSASNGGLFRHGEFSFASGMSYVNLNTKQTIRQGISDNAFTVDLETSYAQGNWLTTVSGQALIYNDRNSFRQEVEGASWVNDGDLKLKSSDASGAIFSIAAGGYWKFDEGNGLLIIGQVGASTVAASERSIANCNNCRSEDIDIDGGLFLKGSIAKQFESMSIGLRVVQYVTGDGVKNSLGVVLSSNF